MHPHKFLEHIVVLSFERRFSKQNGGIRLKSNILVPQISPPKILELATTGFFLPVIFTKFKTWI